MFLFFRPCSHSYLTMFPLSGSLDDHRPRGCSLNLRPQAPFSLSCLTLPENVSTQPLSEAGLFPFFTPLSLLSCPWQATQMPAGNSPETTFLPWYHAHPGNSKMFLDPSLHPCSSHYWPQPLTISHLFQVWPLVIFCLHSGTLVCKQIWSLWDGILLKPAGFFLASQEVQVLLWPEVIELADSGLW